MNYEVVLLSTAQREFHEIVDWLVQRSNTGATNWLKAYEGLVARLEHEPTSFGLAPENEMFPYTIQQALFRTQAGRMYRVLFTVVGKQVRVLHLRGPGQDAV